MKYYGLKRKRICEDLLYNYAKKRAKILSIIPGPKNEFWKRNYEWVYDNSYARYSAQKYSNAIPEKGVLNLNNIVFSDLIRREDIGNLQSGIRHLLKKRRSNRFIAPPIDGLDEICRRIEKMDSTLLSWYNSVECGIFDFQGHSLEKNISHFYVRIRNVNSAFLAVELNVFLSDAMKAEMSTIINSHYSEERGYAFSTLAGNSGTSGAYKNYSIVHYNNAELKADKIYEIISCFEWELFEELNKKIPFVLHKQNIMPPRIETYYTNIDYREDNIEFWDSIGIRGYGGQFIDERQKMFFESTQSERYGRTEVDNRLLYIVKDDGIKEGQLKSVKDEVYYHLRENAVDYFKIMFLRILSKETGKKLVLYRHKLDGIKLQRKQLNRLLELKYNLSKKIDDYNRYMRDDIWDKTKRQLLDIYKENTVIASKAKNPFFYSIENYVESAMDSQKRIDEDIKILFEEYEEKRNILQNLSDYKNNQHSMRLNIAMFIISAVTLFFVVFPEKAVTLAGVIGDIFKMIFQNP